MYTLDTWEDEKKRELRNYKIKRALIWTSILPLGILFWSLIFASCCHADTIIIKVQDIVGVSSSIWCNNIRITEGNKNYGILSIKCNSEIQCREICRNTVVNNWKRYKKSHMVRSLEGFINFLADKYCPSSSDPIGNINWKHNMIKLMKG